MMVRFPVESLMPGPVRPSDGLSARDLAEIEAGSHALPDGWDAVPCEGCDGDLSVLVVPERDDPSAATYVVHREGALIRLDVVRDDAYSRVGAFAAVAPLLRSLAGALRGERPAP